MGKVAVYIHCASYYFVTKWCLENRIYSYCPFDVLQQSNGLTNFCSVSCHGQQLPVHQKTELPFSQLGLGFGASSTILF